MQMYKIFYRTDLFGIFESIVGADTYEQAIEYIKADCAKDGCNMQEVLESMKLVGKGVLLNKFIMK